MRKLWWLVGVGVVLVLCGLFRNVNQALTFGLYGTGLMLFGVIGDTIAPTANKVAYFNKAPESGVIRMERHIIRERKISSNLPW